MSGTIATFTLKSDAKLDLAKLQKDLPAALKKKKITFNGLSMKTTKRAAAAFVVKTPGLT
ncbi:MAG: hypothetical protein AAFU73_01370 [Planctomycetota bacterium]